MCQYLSGELTACTAGLLCIVRMSTPGPALAPSSAPTAPPPLPVSPPACHNLPSPGVVMARSPRPRPRVRAAVSVPAVLHRHCVHWSPGAVLVRATLPCAPCQVPSRTEPRRATHLLHHRTAHQPAGGTRTVQPSTRKHLPHVCLLWVSCNDGDKTILFLSLYVLFEIKTTKLSMLHYFVQVI